MNTDRFILLIIAFLLGIGFVYHFGFELLKEIKAGNKQEPEKVPVKAWKEDSETSDWRDHVIEWNAQWAKVTTAERERDDAQKAMWRSYDFLEKYMGTSREDFYRVQWEADCKLLKSHIARVREEIKKLPVMKTK